MSKEINYNKASEDSDDINFKLLSDIFVRNKRNIALLSLTGFIIGSIYAFSLKRVWKGEFQIVVENKDSNNPVSNLNVDSRLLTLAGVNKKSQLKTQIKILNSPSVLLDIFSFVKKEKASKKDFSLKNAKFKDWQEDQLEIELFKGTSVLYLSYQDTDKDLILPVLEKISDRYQEYSGRKKRRQLELGLNLLNNQIDLYQKRSFKSLTSAQKFSFDNDLKITSQSENSTPIINTELNRIEAIDKINYYDAKINEFKRIGNDSNNILYFADKLICADYSSFFYVRIKELEQIDKRLVELRLLYKDSDKSIQSLLRKRKQLLAVLKTKVEGDLISKKQDAESLLESSKRPEGVLVKYRSLLNTAARDEAILNDLKNQYRALQLEQAKNEDPWELITKPTLLPNPIAPSRRRIALIGIILGLSFGYLIAIINEKIKDIVLSSRQIEEELKIPIISVYGVIDV